MAKMGNFKMGDRKPKQTFHQKKKKNNLVLVFDESARKEYLTGFRKRNLEKRQKKKEEFEKQLKQEKKRIKAEAKQAFKSLIHKRKVIPELEDLINEEIDMGTHTVQIAELSTNQMAEDNCYIGENKVRYEEEEKNEIENEENIKSNSNFVEGMEPKNRKQKQKLIDESNSADFRTARDVKRAVMHQVTQKIQNSKIFRKKDQIERMRCIKRNKREQRRREKKERRQGKKKPKNKKGK